MLEESTRCIIGVWTRLFTSWESILPIFFVLKDVVKVDLKDIKAWA